MSLQLKTPTQALAGMVQLLLQRGADLTSGVVNGKAPTIKSALVTAALESYQNILRDDIRDALRQVYAAHDCIEGPRGEAADPLAWNEAIENDAALACEELLKFVSNEVFSTYVTGAMFDQADGIDRMSAILAEQATKLLKPAGPHMGKFLSAIGIAQPQIDEAEKLAAHQQALYGKEDIAKTTAPPGVEIPALPPGTGLSVSGATHAVPPAPPAGYVPPAPPAPPAGYVPPLPSPLPATQGTDAAGKPASPPPLPGAPRPQPDNAAIKKAIMLWARASGPDYDFFAKKLEMSASTLRNRANGRTEGKITAKQAQLFIADIDQITADLAEAAAIFSAIRA